MGQIEAECTLVRVDNKVAAKDGRDYANGFNTLNPDEVLSEKCLKGQTISNRVAYVTRRSIIFSQRLTDLPQYRGR